MDFEKMFPGCRVSAMDVVLPHDGVVSLIAVRDNADSPWELSDYAKTLAPTLANTSAGKVESPKKRDKKPAADVDDLDL